MPARKKRAPSRSSPKVIALTGAGGQWGRLVLKAAAADRGRFKIVALDRKFPPDIHRCFGLSRAKLVPVEDHLAPGKMAKLLRSHNVDTLCHLAAFLSLTAKGRELVRANVEMTLACLQAAEQAGLRKFVLGSHTVVYGARRGGNVSEEAPLQVEKDYVFSLVKTAVEEVVQERLAKSRLKGLILRRGLLATESLLPVLHPQIPLAPWFLGYDGRLQVIHPDDLAALTWRAIRELDAGVYNLVADGYIRYSEIVLRSGKLPLPMFLWQAKGAARLMELTGQVTTLSGGFKFFAHPPLARNERIKEALGYRFRYDARSAVAAVASS